MAGYKEQAECAKLWKTKAVAAHGGRYDYTESVYVSTRVKLKIRCRKHGSFMQLPKAHLRGHGCPECKIDAIRAANTKNDGKVRRKRTKAAPILVVKNLAIQIMDQRIRGRTNTCAGAATVV